MPALARPGLVPFLLVATSATSLVVWNSLRIFERVHQAAPKPADRVTGSRLDQAAADLSDLLGDRQPHGAQPAPPRQTDLAIRAIHACDARTRHGSTFKSVAAAAPAAAEPLGRAEAALSSACAMRARFSRSLSVGDRMVASAELQSHVSRALAAIQSAQASLSAGQPVPPAANRMEPGALRDPLIGLVGGLICLLFARRPRAAEPASAADRELPAALEPATYRDTALHLLDDSGSFFFTEVFDRAPVPMVLLDADGRIVRLNARAESLAGRSSDELRRQFYWDALLSESSRESARRLFPLPEEVGPVAETWTTRDGGEQTLFWSRALFLEGDAGKAALVLLAGQPVPALPPAPEDAAMQAAARELENELTLVGGHCEMLLESQASGAEPDADLKHLREATGRAILAVRHLLGALRCTDRGTEGSEAQAASFRE